MLWLNALGILGLIAVVYFAVWIWNGVVKDTAEVQPQPPKV